MRALILVDIQNDFCTGGTLAVPQGEAIVPVANRLMSLVDRVVATQDWHPARHGSFAVNHAGRKPFEMGELGGLPQVLWPAHCVEWTGGAQFHPQLDTRRIARVFPKGTDPMIDSYSGFFDNGFGPQERTEPAEQGDALRGIGEPVPPRSGAREGGAQRRKKATGLGDWLKAQRVEEVLVCGLATDYCVKATAIDAAQLGFSTVLVEDACRGVGLKPTDISEAIVAMREAGIIITTAAALSAAGG